jgi:hypothetical protein
VHELGQVVSTREGGVMQNPYLGVMNRQAHIMLRTASELGFSPAARAGLGRVAPEFDPRAPSLGQPRNNTRLAAYLDRKPDKLNYLVVHINRPHDGGQGNRRFAPEIGHRRRTRVCPPWARSRNCRLPPNTMAETG